VHNLGGAKQSLTDLLGFKVGPWANVVAVDSRIMSISARCYFNYDQRKPADARCVIKVMAALGVVPVMLTQTTASAPPYDTYPWCALSPESEADSHASAHVPKQAQLGAAWRRLADTDG
jgi:hypothetical protein